MEKKTGSNGSPTSFCIEVIVLPRILRYPKDSGSGRGRRPLKKSKLKISSKFAHGGNIFAVLKTGEIGMLVEEKVVPVPNDIRTYLAAIIEKMSRESGKEYTFFERN